MIKINQGHYRKKNPLSALTDLKFWTLPTPPSPQSGILSVQFSSFHALLSEINQIVIYRPLLDPPLYWFVFIEARYEHGLHLAL